MQDDKKKMLVLVILVIAILGVGAFQLMPQEPERAAPSTSKKWAPPEEKEGVEAKVTPVRNPSVMAPLSKRDPFDVPAGFDIDGPVVNPANERPTPNPRRVSSMDEPIRPFPVGVDPLPGTQLGREEMPSAIRGNGKPGPTTDSVVKPPEPTFDYSLSGVIVGRTSAAVLKDAQGNQRLVTEGSKIDAHSTLLEVRPNGVTVELNGKKLQIGIQGDKDVK